MNSELSVTQSYQQINFLKKQYYAEYSDYAYRKHTLVYGKYDSLTFLLLYSLYLLANLCLLLLK